MVAVVVEADDFGRQSCSRQRWTKIITDEIGLFFRGHYHTGRVLRIFRLVLWRQSVNVDALGLHALKILHPVVSVGLIAFLLERTTLYIIVVLHPSRSGPGG